MTQAQKNRAGAKAEAILMGMAQPIVDNDEAAFIVDYVIKVLIAQKSITEADATEIMSSAFMHTKNPVVRFISVGVLMQEFVCVTITMTTDEDEGEFQIDNQDGCLSYVANLTAPDLSELGYCFFEKTLLGVKRIA